MNVALVHDYIKEYGGAERVLEALHEIWPKAPVFTTVYLPEFLGPHRERFKSWDIRTSWLQLLPFKEKLISLFRVIAPFVFRGWNFSDYDVVIVSATGAYTPNMIRQKSKGKSQKSFVQICYCHTPPRYLYGYPTAREWKSNPLFRILGEIANHFLRMVDYKSAQNVNFFIANSKNVASRIKKFYGKDAVVIYPPVDTPNYELRITNYEKRRYFLAGGRIARPKRLDLAIEACAKLQVPLKVFGRPFAGYEKELKAQNSKVEFLGEVGEVEKWELMAGARAFIFPAEEEDFGITPVEAMGVGTPVIALRSGGVIESVVENKTGMFFDEPTVDALVNALRQFDKLRWDNMAIAEHARKFGKERFKKEIVDFINSKF